MKSINPSGSLRVNGERPSTMLRTALSERSESNGRSRTIKFFTLGCKVNQYDTQVIREQFLNSGFKEIENHLPADIYVIATCTVTERADTESLGFIRRAKRESPKAKIIVTGCLTELDEDKIKKIDAGILLAKNKDKNKSEFITNFKGHTRAFLKIQDGCNNLCAYCKVRLVRGASRSKPLSEIIQEADKLVKNGFKEIVLSGICLGSYGQDLMPKINLVSVIKALGNIEGLLRIRLSSIEISDVSDELISKIAQSPKLCRHLHIPLQSGDDEILKKMQRNYCREDYLSLIKKIKSRIPEIAITTDVLVGFPGEEEPHFKNTLGLIEEISPLKVHIFPYSPRPGTPAFNFKNKLNPRTLKERVLKLKAVADACSSNYKKQFLNKNMDVLIEGRVKDRPGFWEGYTDNYIKVLVKSSQDLKNQCLCLKLNESASLDNSPFICYTS